MASKDENRNKALDLALGQIDKQFGKGSIMKLSGDNEFSKDIEAVKTGSISLDLALGVGGIPKGRITEIFGPEASGKTTLALHVIRESQRNGGNCVFIDAEHALNSQYAETIGVKLEDTLLSQPDTGEQALEICETLVRSNAIDVVVIDSVAALVPRVEIEGDMGDSHVGLQARLMSQALRKLTAIVSKSNTAVIFINQIREKVGIMFGNPEVTPGGRALKFYTSVRLDIRRIGAIKDGDINVGNRVRVKIVKNKCAAPFRQTEFDLMFGEGISYEGDLLDLAVESNVVDKSGAWYAFNDEKIGQGRENTKVYLKENPNVITSIENALSGALGIEEKK
tara:strand:- start:189 stop:1202 length:1014 start_codon:yes stop_codon:yes gene_type:complete